MKPQQPIDPQNRQHIERNQERKSTTQSGPKLNEPMRSAKPTQPDTCHYMPSTIDD